MTYARLIAILSMFAALAAAIPHYAPNIAAAFGVDVSSVAWVISVANAIGAGITYVTAHFLAGRKPTDKATLFPPGGPLMLIVGIAAFLTACAAIKPVVRTMNDIAEDLCHTTFAAHPESMPAGISVEDLCHARDVIDPFLRQVLAAQREALPAATAAAHHEGQ